MVIEINGFDETGNIGEPIRFVRVGFDKEAELKPFVYNLLHFSKLTLTKKNLRGMSEKRKKDYFRNVFNDDSFSISEYMMMPDVQLKLMRRFMQSEFNYIKSRRLELINSYKSKSWDEVSAVIESFKKYLSSHRYMESCIKSYGHRYAVEDLQNTSRVLKDPRQDHSLIVSQIDGGHPFSFWAETFQNDQYRNGGCFNRRTTPIYGISNGDEYYPSTSLAGNIAYIAREIPAITYSYRLKYIDEVEDMKYDEFVTDFSKHCSSPYFFSRMLFIGYVPEELQYMIPFSSYLKDNRIIEPFRIRESLKSFYNEFKGISKNDIVIRGKLRPNSNDKKIEEEALDYGIQIDLAEDYMDSILNIINEILIVSRDTNLGGYMINVLENKAQKIEKTIKKYTP